MSNIHRTIIVAAPVVALCRQLAEQWDGGTGMYITPLTSDGTTTSHYVSSGLLADTVAYMLPYSDWTTDEDGNYVETENAGNLELMIAAITPEGGTAPFTLEQMQALLPYVDISTQSWKAAAARMGLSKLSEE